MLKIGLQIVFEILLAILLFFNVFVLRTFNLVWVFIGLLGFLIFLLFLIKYKKPSKQRSKTLYYIVVGGCLIVQISFYIWGLFTGFSTSYNVFYKNYLSKIHILGVFFIVSITEMIRYLIFLNYNYNKKDKKKYIARFIMIFNYVLIDYMLLGKSCNFTSRYDLVNTLLIFVIPSIAKNLFLDYTSQKYGYIVNYWYRLIMDLYLYFIPIEPNVNIFIKTVILSVLPYFLYVILENVFGNKKRIARKDKKKNISVNIVTLVILAVLVYLISCQFTYSMIAVGSESMQGTINKGDAVIYKEYKGEKLSDGEVIVFRQNNKLIVHRISSVFELDNGDQAFNTKGDANVSEDNWIVTKENVVGVVKLRVLLIAWPSVLLNEWL